MPVPTYTNPGPDAIRQIQGKRLKIAIPCRESRHRWRGVRQ